jgi:signal transduction histidine kinase
MSMSGKSSHEVTAVQTAARVIELVRDLGECADSKEVLVTAARHYRQLFGDFNMAGLLLEIDRPGHWMSISLESPYTPSWGGVAHQQVPKMTDTEEIVKRLGREVAERLVTDPVLRPRLVDSHEPFWCVDNLVAVRLTALMGAPCRSYMLTPWRRPKDPVGWLVLGYSESRIIGDDALDLFTTVGQMTSRLSMYPALVNYIDRTEKINLSLRRNLVHDLKTPITVIRGYAETLQHREVIESEEMRMEFVNGVLDSCDRLLGDLKDILEPMDSNYHPAYAEFDVSQLLHRAVMAERHTERAKHHKIKLIGADQPLNVEADPRKIRRVVENLLSNAVKYSPGVGKTVTVALARENQNFHVSVRDEGIGMNEDQLAKVMNEGGRVVDDELGIEGSGFGLESARLVIAAHQGRLTAQSKPGHGTTFMVEMPVRKP